LSVKDALMLVSGVPWQAALAYFFVTTALATFCELVSLALAIAGIGWPFALVCLVIALVLLIRNIPLLLNLSRAYFNLLLGLQCAHALITILTCALYYKSRGLIDSRGNAVTNITDSVYYSINTWTTIGVSDLVVQPSQRLLTSLESLVGVISIALFTAMLWLWCTENMLPKERALFDGNRRRKRDLGVTRLRIRTLSGADRDLKGEWIDPPIPGMAYRYDEHKQEWTPYDPSQVIIEGDSFLEAERRD